MVSIDPPYNAILGYSALDKFMAVTHHAYNTVKLSGCSGTITIRGVERDALQSQEEAHKATSAAHPMDEDATEPPEAPHPKRKTQPAEIQRKGKEKLQSTTTTPEAIMPPTGRLLSQ